MAFTEAPEMAAPDLSKIVPEKLALAWPYTPGETQSATADIIATKSNFLIIVHTFFSTLRPCYCAKTAQKFGALTAPDRQPDHRRVWRIPVEMFTCFAEDLQLLTSSSEAARDSFHFREFQN